MNGWGKKKGKKKWICTYEFSDEKQHVKESYLSSNEILLIHRQRKEKRWVRQAATLPGTHRMYFPSGQKIRAVDTPTQHLYPFQLAKP